MRDALARAYDDANLYPPLVPPLRRVLAERHRLTVDRVLVGAGSTELIEATLRAFVGAGDEVVVPVPSWPVLRARLEALDARLVDVPLVVGGDAYAYDVDALLAALTPRTKLLVLCSPNNPTGNSLTVEEVGRCAEAGPVVLVDAAYADFDAEIDLTPLVHDHERLVVTRTFSKAYALAGLRLGYALGDARVLDRVARFLVPASSVSTATLHAGLAALEDDEYQRRQVERIRSERERVVADLRALGLRAFDTRANFVAVDAPGLAARLLGRGVLVRAMDERLVRITIGRADENDLLLAAVAAP